MFKKLGALGVAAALAGFILGVGVGPVTANSSSSTYKMDIGDGNYCYKGYAYTTTSGTYRGGGINNSAYSWNCTTAASHPLGASASLKKSNGSACSTRTPQYTKGKNIVVLAGYSAANCGTGQLAGSGTMYGYNGTGYTSKLLTAPYDGF